MSNTRLRIRLGDREFEAEGEQDFVVEQLDRFLEMSSEPHTNTQGTDEGNADKATRRASSPAEVFRLKKPKTGTEKLLVLGKYLEEQGSKDFRQLDVNKAADDAKQDKIHANYFSTAVKQGLLRVRQGRYSLTMSGEDVVNALPVQKPT